MGRSNLSAFEPGWRWQVGGGGGKVVVCEDERIQWAKLGLFHKRANLRRVGQRKMRSKVRSAFAGWPALGTSFPTKSPSATF